MNPFLLLLILIDVVKHFASSALAGCMGFYVTWIIFWLCGQVESPLPGRILSPKRGDLFTYLACFSGMLFCSAVIHNWLDGLL